MSLNLITKLLVLLLLPLLVTAVSCNKPTEPTTGNVTITVEDASCTEVWLAVNTGNISLPGNFILYENNTRKTEITLTQRDTVIVIENLLPKQNYSYKLMNSNNVSNEVLAITLDTTSHSFSWQTFEFGQHSSSALYDIAIIDENNIWAVGEIYTADSYTYDSLGNWIDPYNAIHWNGSEWELVRIYYIYNGSKQWSPIRTILAFSDSDIWFGAGIHWNGMTFQTKPMNITFPYQINKMWGVSSSDFYIVGNSGSIAHWNGNSWKKIESGTDVDLSSITSGLTVNEVFVSGRGLGTSALIKINNQTIEKLWISDELLNYGSSIWGIKNIDKDLFVACSNGLVRKKLFAGDTEKIVANKTPWQTTAITGDKSNNIFRLCVRSEIYHYNGITDKKIYEDHTTSNRLLSGKVKDNLIIGVGTKSINEVHSKARIIMGSK